MLNHDRGVDVDCPNCRGPPTTKAIFKYLGNSDGDGARSSHHQQATSAARETSADSYGTATSAVVLVMTTEQFRENNQSWTSLEPAEYFRQQGVELADGDRGSTNPDTTHEHQQVHIKAPPGLAGTKLPGGKLSILADLWPRIKQTTKRQPMRQGRLASISTVLEQAALHVIHKL